MTNLLNNPAFLTALVVLMTSFGTLLTALAGWIAYKQNENGKIAQQTNQMVNGAHGIALRTILEQATKIANLTNTPRDVTAITTAQQAVQQHDAGAVAVTKGKVG